MAVKNGLSQSGLSALLRSAAKDLSFSSASKALITFLRGPFLRAKWQPQKGGLFKKKHDSRNSIRARDAGARMLVNALHQTIVLTPTSRTGGRGHRDCESGQSATVGEEIGDWHRARAEQTDAPNNQALAC